MIGFVYSTQPLFLSSTRCVDALQTSHVLDFDLPAAVCAATWAGHYFHVCQFCSFSDIPVSCRRLPGSTNHSAAGHPALLDGFKLTDQVLDVAEPVVARCAEDDFIIDSEGIVNDVYVATTSSEDAAARIEGLLSKEDVVEVAARGACSGNLGSPAV